MKTLKSITANFVLPFVLGIHAYAGTFTDNFSTGLNSAYWSITSSSDYSVNATGSSVVLSKVGTTSGNVAVSISLNLAALGGNVSGDFLDQISFSNAVVGPGYDGVQLDDSFADGSHFDNVYGYGTDQSLSSGTNVHIWNGATKNPTSVTGNSGIFAIGRSGSTVTGYFNNVAIFSETESSALTYIDFRLETHPNASTDSSSATFTTFSLTATSVPEPSTLATTGVGVVMMWWMGRRKILARQGQSLIPIRSR